MKVGNCINEQNRMQCFHQTLKSFDLYFSTLCFPVLSKCISKCLSKKRCIGWYHFDIFLCKNLFLWGIFHKLPPLDTILKHLKYVAVMDISEQTLGTKMKHYNDRIIMETLSSLNSLVFIEKGWLLDNWSLSW